jgi:hypothetical protein
MAKKIFFWTLTVLITLFTVVYQRLTGPTHPKKFQVEMDGKHYKYKLPTSSNGTTNCEVKIDIPDVAVTGHIIFKRYRVNESPDTITFNREGNSLIAMLPGQPAAGKLEYRIELFKSGKHLQIINDQHVVIRFKESVPAYVLIPHILFIFTAMLLSTLAGFFAAGNIPSYKFYTGLTLILFMLGGMLLGPIVQKFAFGEFWTGFPFGKDFTDNKTLIAFGFWIIAWIGNRRADRRYLVILAAIMNLTIGLIPHSTGGSELDYSSGEIKTGMIFINWII